MGWGPDARIRADARAKKEPPGIYSKDPFGDLREAMKTLHVDCSPADWQRFEELERESAYRDFTIEDAENIKGCEHLVELPERMLTEGVLERVRDMHLDLLRATDLASQVCARLADQQTSGSKFLSLWTNAGDAMDEETSMKQQRNELQEKLEAEMAKHEETYKTLRQMRQSMASKIREATKEATEEMVRTGKRVTELEEEVERLQKDAGSVEKKLKKALASEQEKHKEQRARADKAEQRVAELAPEAEKVPGLEARVAALSAEVAELRATDAAAMLERQKALTKQVEDLERQVKQERQRRKHVEAEKTKMAEAAEAAAREEALNEDPDVRVRAAQRAAREAEERAAAAEQRAAAEAERARSVQEAEEKRRLAERSALEDVIRELQDELAATAGYVPGGAVGGLGERLARVKGKWLVAEARVLHTVAGVDERLAAQADALTAEKDRALAERAAAAAEQEERRAAEVAGLAAELARWRADYEAEQQAHGETSALLEKERKTNAVLRLHCETSNEATLAPLPAHSQTFCAFCRRYVVYSEEGPDTLYQRLGRTLPSVGDVNGHLHDAPAMPEGLRTEFSPATRDVRKRAASASRDARLVPGGVRARPRQRQDVARAGGVLR